MQNNSHPTKLYLLFLCFTITCSVNAQDTPVENYLQQAGPYAELYNGRMETAYNPLLYKNLPYYTNADFTDATIFYRKNYYPNQKVRLDLFREQLLIMSSERKQYVVVVCPSDLEKVYMYNKTFVWLDPPKENRLKTGYYMQLSEGKKIQLFCKESYFPQRDLQSAGAITYFEREIRYYLQYNNRYYMVKDKGSFSKIFRQYKKQINKFVKDQKLDFRQTPEKSLISLTSYCEGLLNSTNSQ